MKLNRKARRAEINKQVNEEVERLNAEGLSSRGESVNRRTACHRLNTAWAKNENARIDAMCDRLQTR